jgi:hypothetical protein
MKQISQMEEKPFKSSLNICPEARARIFKLLRSPRIYSKEPIPLGCLAWRASKTTLFLYLVLNPHRLFKNSSTAHRRKQSIGKQAMYVKETKRNIQMQGETNPCCRLCVSVAKMLNKAGRAGARAPHRHVCGRYRKLSTQTADVFCPNVCLHS